MFATVQMVLTKSQQNQARSAYFQSQLKVTASKNKPKGDKKDAAVTYTEKETEKGVYRYYSDGRVEFYAWQKGYSPSEVKDYNLQQKRAQFLRSEVERQKIEQAQQQLRIQKRKLSAQDFVMNVEAGKYIAQTQGEIPYGMARGEYYTRPARAPTASVEPSEKVFGRPSLYERLTKKSETSNNVAVTSVYLGSRTVVGVAEGAKTTVSSPVFWRDVAILGGGAIATGMMPAIAPVTVPAMYGYGGYRTLQYGVDVPGRISASQEKARTVSNIFGEVGAGVAVGYGASKLTRVTTTTEPADSPAWEFKKTYKTRKVYPDYGVPETEVQRQIVYEPKLTQRISDRYLTGKQNEMIISDFSKTGYSMTVRTSVWTGYEWYFGKQPIIAENTKIFKVESKPQKPAISPDRLKMADISPRTVKTVESSGYAQELLLEELKPEIIKPSTQKVRVKSKSLRTLDSDLGTMQSQRLQADYVYDTSQKLRTKTLLVQETRTVPILATDTVTTQKIGLLNLGKQRLRSAQISEQVQSPVVSPIQIRQPVFDTWQSQRQEIIQQQQEQQDMILGTRMLETGLGIPVLYGRTGSGKKSHFERDYRLKQPSEYVPSLTGLFMGIKTPKLKGKRLTGLEIRGM